MGGGKPGQACLTVELSGLGIERIERKVPFGQVVVLPLPESGTLDLTARPERGFDLGAGKGAPLTAKLHGGVVGLIVDTRGRRPFALPSAPSARIERLRAWNAALGLYPREV